MLTSRTLLTAGLLTGLASASSVFATLGTWTNLDGQKMQAEYLGRKGGYVTFKKEDGSRYLYPYAKLTDADRARIDALAAPPPESDVAAPAADAPQVARVGALSAALAGKLVAIDGATFAPVPGHQLNTARYIAIYYSAHWCPPCRAFTPELVASYKKIKAAHPEFELVFVSSDQNEDAMKGYMSEYGMTWPALRFDQLGTAGAVRRPDYESGIPNLVFMDADGKELSTSFTKSGDYRGPRNVLNDIKKHFRL